MELTDLYEFAEEHDIDVVEFKMQSVKSQSQMRRDLSCCIAIDTRQFSTTAEEKAALAHEVGHCLTGGFYNRHSIFNERARCERRANKKAVRLLLPPDKLAEALAEPWNSVYDIAERFGVPEDTVKMALELYEDDLREAYAKRAAQE